MHNECNGKEIEKCQTWSLKWKIISLKIQKALWTLDKSNGALSKECIILEL